MQVIANILTLCPMLIKVYLKYVNLYIHYFKFDRIAQYFRRCICITIGLFIGLLLSKTFFRINYVKNYIQKETSIVEQGQTELLRATTLFLYQLMLMKKCCVSVRDISCSIILQSSLMYETCLNYIPWMGRGFID